ncbi:MAG: DNA-binding protein [Cyanobacteria bacterium J06581_3]
MKEYDFTLSFLLGCKDEDPAIYEEALFNNGCDDALVGVGRKGQIALMFIREAESAQDAIGSAISNVLESIPDARLCEAQPDLSGLTDIAKLVGCSRQNVRKLMIDSFDSPPPVHSGHPMLWHLADVLVWLQQSKDYKIASELIEVAKITQSLNAITNWETIEPSLRKQVYAMVAPSSFNSPMSYVSTGEKSSSSAAFVAAEA